MPKTKSKHSDRPLTASEAKDLCLSVPRGYKHLKLKPDTSAEKIQEAIRAAIDAICLGKKKATAKAVEDLGINLGCLWRQTVCD